MGWETASAVIYDPRRRAFDAGDDDGVFRRDLEMAIVYPLQRGQELVISDWDGSPQVYMLLRQAHRFVQAGDWADWKRYALLPSDPEPAFGAPQQCKACNGALWHPLFAHSSLECRDCGQAQDWVPPWVNPEQDWPIPGQRKKKSRKQRKAERNARRKAARRIRRRLLAKAGSQQAPVQSQ